MTKQLYAQGGSAVGLLTYRLPSGRVEAVALDYLGIVCSSPAVISLSWMEAEGERPDPEGDFAVCLPAEEVLRHPDFAGALGRGEDFMAAAGLKLLGGEVPLIAGCPVQIECRRREEAPGFGPPLLRGEVTALRIDGRVRPQKRLGDLAGLARSLASQKKGRSGPPVNIPWELLGGAPLRCRSGEAGLS